MPICRAYIEKCAHSYPPSWEYFSNLTQWFNLVHGNRRDELPSQHMGLQLELNTSADSVASTNSIQVSMMYKIYSTATKVIIDLGDVQRMMR
jgi:hypothetical protein